MANINKELNDIKNAVYGREVRGSIHDGIKKINEEVENTTDRQDSVEAQFQSVLDETTGKDVISAPEINAAKVGADNTNYPNLKERLDTEHNQLSSRLAQTEQEVEKKIDKVDAATKEQLQQGLNTKITKGTVTRQDLDTSSDSHKWDLNDFNEQSRQAILEANNIDINYVLGEDAVTTENLTNKSVTFEKRTRLGEVGIITLSLSTEKYPNIDTENLKLTFPSTFFIVTGKHRYRIDDGIEIDLQSNYVGRFIYFDTDTQEFIVLNQTHVEVDVKESYVLIAWMYRSQNDILGAWMSCPFTIDGVDASIYFINKIPQAKIPDITSLPLITVGQYVPLPNFDTKNNTMTFESMRIFYRDKVYYINEPVVLDFSTFTSAGRLVYFDTATGEFFIRNQTNIGYIPETAILIAVLYYYDGDKKNILINTEYTIDGKPKYMPYSNMSSLSKNIEFNVDTLVADFPDMYLPGVGDLESPFNYDDDNHELVYGLFDDLMDQAPGYITKTELGKTDIGTPVYEYFFDPQRAPEIGATGFYKPYPKILIGAAVHGGENLGVIALYYLMERIVNGWKDDKALEYLRHNVRLAICPLRSPDDFDRKSYVNHNGVNINRNFSWGWEERNDPTKGPYPFSEVEARIQRDWLHSHDDAIHHIDVHVRGGRQTVTDDSMIDIRYEGDHDVQPAENLVMKLSRRWQKRYSQLPNHPLGYIWARSAGGTIGGYSRHVVGLSSYTWEGFSKSETMNEVENSDIVSMNVEFLGQTVVNLIKYYQKF